ncbi:MAG TPA: hypothetical protein VN493_17710 [Thermoanaerobaculia bacterium]|nr:hypothetical protein [Thermoanaerobaculia bacterium]
MALKRRTLLTYVGLAALVLIWGSTWAAIRVSLTLWLGEPFTARIFVGGLLVVAGVAIAVR